MLLTLWRFLLWSNNDQIASFLFNSLFLITTLYNRNTDTTSLFICNLTTALSLAILLIVIGKFVVNDNQAKSDHLQTLKDNNLHRSLSLSSSLVNHIFTTIAQIFVTTTVFSSEFLSWQALPTTNPNTNHIRFHHQHHWSHWNLHSWCG